VSPPAGETGTRAAGRRIYLDRTHLRAHVTGIERITLDLFAAERLAPHAVRPVTSATLPGMIAAQHLGLPARALLDRRALFLFPGFPPGPLCAIAAARCLLYVHDTFLLTRPEDLSLRSRLYMSPSFALALRWCPNLFVNSRTTGEAVRALCHPRARVALLRPAVRDAFGLGDLPGAAPFTPGTPLRLLAIGTIEPRKNYPAALALTAALIRAGIAAELHLVGRVGWGRHAFLDDAPPFLHRHGYLPDAALRALAGSCHLLLSTSKAEGLGLPLLEVQHGGLPVAAPDEPVFREVLGSSGLLIRPEDPELAARALAAAIADGALIRAGAASRGNVAAWNARAAEDADRFARFLADDPAAYAATEAVVAASVADPVADSVSRRGRT
jgi:glycosyltransferase involved in cell wall biosynthesis